MTKGNEQEKESSFFYHSINTGVWDFLSASNSYTNP